MCEQASFGPEFEISQTTVLDISYVGNFGRKENRLRNSNQAIIEGYSANGQPIILFPYPNLNTSQTSVSGTHAFLEMSTDDGNANYNALLVSLRKRFSTGPLLRNQLHLQQEFLRLRG